jgi:hypothetical protein
MTTNPRKAKIGDARMAEVCRRSRWASSRGGAELALHERVQVWIFQTHPCPQRPQQRDEDYPWSSPIAFARYSAVYAAGPVAVLTDMAVFSTHRSASAQPAS